MLAMYRIVFMGTPTFAVPILQCLIETQQVVGVVTQPDRPAGRGQQLQPSPVKQLAENSNIPLYQPLSLRSEQAIRPIRDWQPEAIVVAAFGQILRPLLLNLPPLGCLNVHASLLPRWRGASPIQHAILVGDLETGISLMQMDVGLDTGAVYGQLALPITATETAQTLHDRLAILGADLLRRMLNPILAGKVPALPQNNSLATYAPMIKKEDGRLNWRESSLTLDRHIRAMTPWPGAYSQWGETVIKIMAARSFPDHSLLPGQVTARGQVVVVGTGDGALELLQVQLAGKRVNSAAEFVRGRPEFLQSQLQ